MKQKFSLRKIFYRLNKRDVKMTSTEIIYIGSIQ